MVTEDFAQIVLSLDASVVAEVSPCSSFRYSFLYRLSFVWYMFQEASLLLYLALLKKLRQVCVPPRRFVLCFDCSAWASLFYGFTADLSESID